MTKRWWGGPGISIILHAALLVVLISTAGRSSRIDARTSTASRPVIYTVVSTPGPGGSGGGDPNAAAPRRARVPRGRPPDVVAPRMLTNTEPLPVAVIPSLATQDMEFVPGALVAVDGTSAGRGSGRGGGGGNGPGIGPGDGPGIGDVYEAGVGGTSNPQVLYEVKPNFTIDAVRAKVEGLVVLEVVVRADGSVDPGTIRVTRSLDSGLDREAVLAVRQWRFRPSMRLGRPVASRVIVELAFTLR